MARQAAEADVGLVLGDAGHLLRERDARLRARPRCADARPQSRERVDDARRRATTAIPERAIRRRAIASPVGTFAGGDALNLATKPGIERRAGDAVGKTRHNREGVPRRRQLEAVETNVLRGRMIAIIVPNPLNEREHLLRVPMRRAEGAKPLSWIAVARSHVAIDLHRLCH